MATIVWYENDDKNGDRKVQINYSSPSSLPEVEESLPLGKK